MSRITKRPQNMCYNCWYTWYPRGKNISNVCPNCGNRNVGFDWSGILLFLFLLFILAILLN